MNNIRTWVYRVMVIIGMSAFITSWFMQWWGCKIVLLGDMDKIKIFVTGLKLELGEWAQWITGYDMPVWFAPLMWVYFGLVIIGILYAIWKMDKHVRLFGRDINLSRFLIGLIGFSYCVVVILACVVAAIRTGDYYGTHLLGWTWIEAGITEKSYIYSFFRPGYWLAVATGPFLLFLSLFRNKILGKDNVASNKV
jgi:hypothetical protein